MSDLAVNPVDPTPESAEREPKVVRLSSMRKRIGAHMVASVATSPHVAMAVEVDFSAVDAVRTAVGPAWREREGSSLTYLPFIASALCQTIAAFPNVNASIVGDALHVYPYVNLGLAVDLDFQGLVVPVIRDAERLSVAELARAASDLANRARTKKLGPDEFAGGTYTLTNNGRSTYFTTPIINQPQIAILSSDGVKRRPVVIDDEDTIAVRPIGLLTQAFDHRAVDGAYSGAFLGRLKTEIEDHDWSTEPF
ncbi:MAG: 2-oxoglutarate dehydrogenase, component, dihydrolipoamide succinyltransferase [Pseudonocardiales bacterium]|nr:2-oxoglutarate dehydrogenase, component, dihydrolipoamide succinyltransferase [Pseudonocardiales bacterium]